MDKDNRKLYLYSSLFITLVLNMPKLLALRKEGVVARYWHFDLYELLFQVVLTFLFCILAFYINQRGWRTLRVLITLLILVVFTATGALVQKKFFQPGLFPTGGYGLRFSISLILVALELRIAWLLRNSREKEMENAQLKNAWLKSQMALLKGQLNPHFFFNAMSSLSAIVREDPRKAQQYIHHLSRVFRNSLTLSDTDLISLDEEIAAVRSYCELLKMRYEDGFRLELSVEHLKADLRIPPMSLQLLVENAVKHNNTPLYVQIRTREGYLEVKNNLSPVRVPEPGTGMGLANLNERCKILLHREIEIIKDEDSFTVRLPLLK